MRDPGQRKLTYSSQNLRKHSWKERVKMQNSELLFYGGILIMSIAVIVMTISLIMFHITGRRIKKRLEEEYGKPYK